MSSRRGLVVVWLVLAGLTGPAAAQGPIIVPSAAIGCTDISTLSPLCVAGLPNVTGTLLGVSASDDIGIPTSITGDWNFAGTLTIGGIDVTGAATLRSTMSAGASTFSGHVAPSATDSYDLGHANRLWRQAYMSQVNAIVFAEQTVSLVGGWLVVSPDQGTFGADVSAGSTTINFDKAMTPGDFVLVRAHDAVGTIRAEYLQVGSLVIGNTYNVTRDLASAHSPDPAWVAGTPFMVLGASGDGRIELDAYNSPRISIIEQGATYDAQSDLVRIGYLDGISGIASGKLGLHIRDATTHLRYYDLALRIAAAAGVVNVDANGVSVAPAAGTSPSSLYGYRFTSAASGLSGMFGGEASSTRYLWLYNNPTTASWQATTTVEATAADGDSSYLQLGTAGTPSAVLASDGLVQLVANTGTVTVYNGYAQFSTDLQVRFDNSASDPGMPWTRSDGNDLYLNGSPGLYLNYDVAGSITTNGAIVPKTDDTDTIGSYNKRYTTINLALPNNSAPAFVVVNKGGGGSDQYSALGYIVGFSGCLAGKTIIAGIVTDTGC